MKLFIWESEGKYAYAIADNITDARVLIANSFANQQLIPLAEKYGSVANIPKDQKDSIDQSAKYLFNDWLVKELPPVLPVDYEVGIYVKTGNQKSEQPDFKTRRE